MQVTRLLLLASMGLIVQEKQPLQKNCPNISQAIILKVQLEYSSVQPQRTFHALGLPVLGMDIYNYSSNSHLYQSFFKEVIR